MQFVQISCWKLYKQIMNSGLPIFAVTNLGQNIAIEKLRILSKVFNYYVLKNLQISRIPELSSIFLFIIFYQF